MQLNTENARRNTPHNEKPMLPVEIKRLHGNVFACDHGSFAEWKFPSSLPQQLPLRPALQCGQKFNFLIWRCWGCPTHCVSPFRFLSFLPSFFLSFLPSFLPSFFLPVFLALVKASLIQITKLALTSVLDTSNMWYPDIYSNHIHSVLNSLLF
jgi:hypothetical protein